MPILSPAWLATELLAFFNSRIAASEDEAWLHLARRAAQDGGEPPTPEQLRHACHGFGDDGLLEQRGPGQWRMVRLRDVADLPEEVPVSSAPHYSGQSSVAVRLNRYERDRNARRRCIEHYGARCAVCDFDFERVYGALGRGCIRVHHVVPQQQLGPDYRLDPVRDLRPVCANCHCMLHRTEPPAEIEQLRRLLRRQEQQQPGEPAVHRP